MMPRAFGKTLRKIIERLCLIAARPRSISVLPPPALPPYPMTSAWQLNASVCGPGCGCQSKAADSGSSSSMDERAAIILRVSCRRNPLCNLSPGLFDDFALGYAVSLRELAPVRYLKIDVNLLARLAIHPISDLARGAAIAPRSRIDHCLS